MRLICPGCAAQYEVQANAIPPEGRDVQCSNCGRTWFQKGPLPDGTLPQDRDDAILAAAAMPPPAAEPAQDTPEIGTPEPDAPEPDAPDTDSDANGDMDGDAEGTPPPRPARKVDDAVLAVLREEAEREARARRADAAAALETQPDLGLALQPQAAPRRPPERIAKISDPVAGTDIAELRRARTGIETSPSDAAQPVSGDDDDDIVARARRNRLPDIEEINSTLRGTADRPDMIAPLSDAPEHGQETRRGFRTGFLSVVLLGVVALLVYALAGQIAAFVPALGPLLQSYVGAVDSLRLSVSGASETLMRTLLNWLS